MELEEKLRRKILEKTQKGILFWQPVDGCERTYETNYGDIHLTISWEDDFHYSRCILKISDDGGETSFCQKNMGSAPIARLLRAIEDICKQRAKDPEKPIKTEERLTSKLFALLR